MRDCKPVLKYMVNPTFLSAVEKTGAQGGLGGASGALSGEGSGSGSQGGWL